MDRRPLLFYKLGRVGLLEVVKVERVQLVGIILRPDSRVQAFDELEADVKRLVGDFVLS